MATNERDMQDQARGLSRGRTAELSRRGREPFGFSSGEFLSNPFAIMRRMHDDMDRMMAEHFGGTVGAGAMGGLGGWSPAVEVSHRDNQLHVCAELPGLRPEDVKIEVTDDALIIEGERKSEHEDKQGGRWHSERQYGRFMRTIPLPEGARTEQAHADFKNGELLITVPVEAPQSKRRQIPIGGTAQSEPKQETQPKQK